MTHNLEELWSKILKRIEMEVSGPNYKTWFKDTFPISLNNNVLEIGVPNKIVKDWLADKFHTLILKIVSEFVENIKNIEYTVAKKQDFIKNQELGNVKEDTLSEELAEEGTKTVETLPIYQEMKVSEEDNLNPKYTFDTFVVGKFNQLAYAAAEAVIKNPGLMYNPLFVYGDTGHGKTHLLQAIGNKLKKDIDGFKVYYVSSEQFAIDYVNAIKSGKANSFKDKYRKYDLIIMDDIQFIADKEQTQEELFHLFNAMHDKNKQVIFSSDKHPNQIPGFAERLKSRFAAGMIVEIPAPDYESRLEILKTKAKLHDIELKTEILETIAKELPGNIRELEGALNLVVMQAKVQNGKINTDKVKEIIRQLSRPRKNISINEVIEKIANYYEISVDELKKKSRKKNIVHPRQVIMYVLRELFNESFPSIGEALGGRDHTTVMHSYEKIKQDLKEDPALQREINEIKEMFNYLFE